MLIFFVHFFDVLKALFNDRLTREVIWIDRDGTVGSDDFFGFIWVHEEFSFLWCEFVDDFNFVLRNTFSKESFFVFFPAGDIIFWISRDFGRRTSFWFYTRLRMTWIPSGGVANAGDGGTEGINGIECMDERGWEPSWLEHLVEVVLLLVEDESCKLRE